MTEPKVAIILLNYNTIDDTIDCVESLRHISYSNYKIVIVDNNSRDQEGCKLKEKYPFVHLIQNTTNRGFTGGNNDGISWAKTNGFDLVWILNNDTVVAPDALSQQIKHFTDPQVGVVGPKIKMHKTDLIWANGCCIFQFQPYPPFIKFFSNIDEGRPDTHRQNNKVKYLSGCSMLYPLNLNHIYFDENFFSYCEDLKLCYLIRQDGKKIIYEPSAVVEHKVFRKTHGSKFTKQTAYYSYRNKLVFLNEFFPKYKSILLLPIYFLCVLRDCFRILLYLSPKKELFHAVFAGVGDGLKTFFRKGPLDNTKFWNSSPC